MEGLSREPLARAVPLKRVFARAAAIPLDRLIAPLVIIDVREQAARDRDYALAPADIAAHERQFGRIPRGAIVVLRIAVAETPGGGIGTGARHEPGRDHARSE